MRRCPLTKSRRKARSARRRSPRNIPLVLTTGGRISFFFNSEHRQIDKLRKAQRDPIAEIHPETAARFGIANGAWMWIETKRGRIRQKAKLTNGNRPAGHPRRSTAGGFPNSRRRNTAC